MNGSEILQSVQFVRAKGKRFAVIDAEEWEILIEWIETLEDIQVLRQASSELMTVDGDRKRAGWLEWETVAREI
ncbi:MAG: hypothetical protein HC916_10065 [Coleofasciculaceae cyanobacterium SM2_1_6]|nr:hypothetical protein [Coleofasciculaceae cyanobacterium SM2_1_6]